MRYTDFIWEDTALKTSKSFYDWLFIGTLLFFGLSLIHISFALLGILCAITPFVLVSKTGKKRWCQSYCPRASLLTTLFNRFSLKLTPTKWLYAPNTKRYVLNLFCMNLVMIVLSTMMVASNRMPAMDYVRFLMAFPIPIELPQLLTFNMPEVVIHLSYRVFSIMFTSTILGLLLGFLFRPRSWCAVCPVQTLTTTMIQTNS